MSEVTGSKSWREELASLVEDTGIVYSGDGIGISTQSVEMRRSEFSVVSESPDGGESEGFKDQVKGFLKAWGELLLELGRGCKDIAVQSFVTEDSYVVKKVGGTWAKVSSRLRFLNDFLPEDRDPVHAWPVVFFRFHSRTGSIECKYHT